MNHALKLAAALGLSLPMLIGGSASAAPVSPAANHDDNPVAVLIGQAVVSGNEISGNADRNQ